MGTLKSRPSTIHESLDRDLEPWCGRTPKGPFTCAAMITDFAQRKQHYVLAILRPLRFDPGHSMGIQGIQCDPESKDLIPLDSLVNHQVLGISVAFERFLSCELSPIEIALHTCGPAYFEHMESAIEIELKGWPTNLKNDPPITYLDLV